MKNRGILVGITLAVAAVLLLSGCNPLTSAPQAKEGDTVQVHYTGRLVDGTIFDSSAGKDPLKFTIGSGQVIPGFDKAVIGMKVGDKKTVKIPAADAYGPVRQDLIGEIPRDRLPQGVEPQVGQQLQSTQKNGQTIIVTITKVSDNTVTIDANHPLAGQDLVFDLELVKIL